VINWKIDILEDRGWKLDFEVRILDVLIIKNSKIQEIKIKSFQLPISKNSNV
jgi:hypothetical protein